MIWISQADTIALYSFYNLVYGIILCDDLTLQFFCHLQESAILSLSHTLYRNTCHFTHHGSNVIYFYWCAMTVAFTVLPFFSGTCQHLLHLGLLVTISSGQFIVLIRYSILLICNQYFYIMLQFQNVIRNACILKMYARADLVKNIYGLVWEETVSNISVSQFHTCFQCFITIGNLMEFLIGVLDVMKYPQCLLWRCRIDEEDYFRVRLQFVHDSLDTLFEGTAIFSACDKTRKIETDDTLIKEEWGRLVVLDELG